MFPMKVQKGLPLALRDRPFAKSGARVTPAAQRIPHYGQAFGSLALRAGCAAGAGMFELTFRSLLL